MGGHPEYIFYALVVLLVLPSMWFNRMAVVLMACWAPGQILAQTCPDLPSEYSYMIEAFTDSVGLAAGIVLCYVVGNTGTMITTVLFLPAMTVHLLQFYQTLDPQPGGGLHPYYAWWIIFWISIFQCLSIPLGNRWRPILAWAHRRGLHDDPDADFHFFSCER